MSTNTTKILTDAAGQSVRIPQEYRFKADEEVFINKIGDTLLITPVNALPAIFDQGVAMLTDDFLADGVPKSIPSPREGLDIL